MEFAFTRMLRRRRQRAVVLHRLMEIRISGISGSFLVMLG